MDTKKLSTLLCLLMLQVAQPSLAQANYSWRGCILAKFGKVCFKVFSDNEGFTTQFVVRGKSYTLPGASFAEDDKHPGGLPEHSFSPDGRGMIFQPVLIRGLRPPSTNYYLVIDTRVGNVYSADGTLIQPGKNSNYTRLPRIEARWLPEQPHTWATVQPNGTLSDPVQLPN
jgi:hypothetical protein